MSNSNNCGVPEVSNVREVDQKNSSFQNRFWKLFQSRELSDVTLIVGEKKERIKSHKIVLAAASDVFKKYFTEDRVKNEVIISNVEPVILLPFLKFVYTGEVSLEVKNVIPILNAAIYFEVQELVALCEEKLKSALTEQTALLLFEQAILYGQKELEETAKKIVCKFTYNIFETKEFLEVGEECLLKFLGEDNLIVTSELQVFDALVRWAKAECKRQGVIVTPKYCRSHLEKLIPLIRFPQMDEGDFALKVAHGENQVLTQEEILSVYFYQKIPMERRSEVPSGLFNSKPRMYIDSMTVKIHVKTLIGSETMKLKPLDTVACIKEWIDRNDLMPSIQQCLTFQGDTLQDQQTLLDCNILKESTLQCLLPADQVEPSTGQPINIKIFPTKEKSFTLIMDPSSLVDNLRTHIHVRTGIEPSQQTLIYSYRDLQLDNGDQSVW